jgi:hypothetical protein
MEQRRKGYYQFIAIGQMRQIVAVLSGGKHGEFRQLANFARREGREAPPI